jgi:uncharacterized protein (DUF433 family)
MDPNEIPRYSVREAARYLQMPGTTLKSWVSGRTYPVGSRVAFWRGLITRPDPGDPRLSFSNLIEAHVLRALRQQYGVRMPQVRTALEYARERWGTPRVLLSPHLRAMPGNVFRERLGRLVNIGRGGQEAMPEVLSAFLDRVEWDMGGGPSRIFPWTRPDRAAGPRLVAIAPRIAFGRPVLDRKGIKTASIAERFRAGEAIAEIAADYDLSAAEVEEALRYEALAAAA